MSILKHGRNALQRGCAVLRARTIWSTSKHDERLFSSCRVSSHTGVHVKSSRSCSTMRANAGDGKLRLQPSSTLNFVRHKSKSTNDEDEEEDEWDESVEDDPDLAVGRDHKDIETSIASLRMDTVLKAGLNLSNSKIEAAFYEGNVRVNGEKVLKKSKEMNVGDEIDVIVGVNEKTKNYLDVKRVVIMASKFLRNAKEKHVRVKLRRFARLTVSNYGQKWTPPASEETSSP